MLQTLLHHLAEGDGWDTAIGSPVDEDSVAAATKPLTDAEWKHTVDGRWIRWTNLSGDAGIQFDAFAARQPNCFGQDQFAGLTMGHGLGQAVLGDVVSLAGERVLGPGDGATGDNGAPTRMATARRPESEVAAQGGGGGVLPTPQFLRGELQRAHAPRHVQGGPCGKRLRAVAARTAGLVSVAVPASTVAITIP
ncbi:hypothetical protein [Streptomyces soliscabiei]|uniref:hypothetical protein n=1 Tax=Streptomyces soliscabiei TaxID=588897 RepID=UPI0029C098FA|nr:hypothetical protein [Streptomyces sp. NY05-11A]